MRRCDKDDNVDLLSYALTSSRHTEKSFFKWPVTTAQGEIFGLILKLRTSDVHKMYSISDLPCQLFYGMIWEEKRKRRKRKKRRGGENEEELEGLGLFGPFARISNSKENAQPARQ